MGAFLSMGKSKEAQELRENMGC